jgi:GTP-binding protein EngB required for normal cell division
MLQLIDHIPVAPPVPVAPVRAPTNDKYVMGPVSLSEHYSSKYGKHIYIFGDLHDKQFRPCDTPDTKTQQIHIKYFIDQLIRRNIQNGKETDVFLEGFVKYVKSVNQPVLTPNQILQSEPNEERTLRWYSKLGEEAVQDYIKRVPNATEEEVEKIRIRGELEACKDDLDYNVFNANQRNYLKQILNEETEDAIALARIKSFIRSIHHVGNYLGDVSRHYASYLEHTDVVDLYNFNQKARFHSIDVRYICDYFDDDYNTNNVVCLTQIGIQLQKRGIVDGVSAILDRLEQLGKSMDDDQLMRHVDSFLEQAGVTKEVYKVQDPFIQAELKTLLDVGKKRTCNHIKQVMETKQMSGLSTADFLIEFMDIYCLARIFKNSNYKHIIIYAGDYHARVYRAFLQRIGVSTRRATDSFDQTCINVGTFEPFFDHLGNIDLDQQPQQLTQSHVNYLFFGNPGSGKSTLVNNIVGKVVSKSGISVGRGLTVNPKRHIVDGIGYVDVPGISDIAHTGQQQMNIILHVLTNQIVNKIFFVSVFDSGFRDDDVDTIQFVLNIAKYLFKKDHIPYGLILTKISPALFTRTKEIENYILERKLNKFPPHSIYYFMRDDRLYDKSNVLIDLPPDFNTFLQGVPAVVKEE